MILNFTKKISVNFQFEKLFFQLSSLKDPQATSGSAKFAASPDVNLHAVYSSLAKLLSALIVIDGIILQHSNLRGHWATYRRYIKAAIMDPSQFNVDTLEMKKLEKLLGPAESKIIDGNLFKVRTDFDSVLFLQFLFLLF